MSSTVTTGHLEIGEATEPRVSQSGGGVLFPSICGVGITLALWFAGQGSLLRVEIPAMAFLLGLILYVRRPVQYVQYTLWVWFLAPLFRRLVDWRFGFVEPNMVLLAPFLVSGTAVLSLLPAFRQVRGRIPISFVLCGAGILYGFVIGMLMKPGVASVFGLLNWLCPMLFGLHLFLRWPEYQEYQAAISRTFVQALLVVGGYGVYQFFFPPAWDRYWLENVMATSPTFGLPEPLLIRVWSTMNSPGPFANAILAGLLLLVVVRSPLKLPAGALGYLSFLLSIVRTAWLSWMIGLILLLKSAKPKMIARVLVSIILLGALLIPLTADPRIATVVSDRFNSFADLGHDESAGARMDLYRVMADDALHHPFGYGLDTSEQSHGRIDSGLLALVFSLGWLGSVLFGLGVISIFTRRTGSSKTDVFFIASKAISIAILAQILSGPIFVNVIGAMFWLFAGMYLSAAQFHANEPVASAEAVLV